MSSVGMVSKCSGRENNFQRFRCPILAWRMEQARLFKEIHRFGVVVQTNECVSSGEVGDESLGQQ